jgi:hypothetical protein
MFPILDDALNTFVIGLGMLPWSNFRVEYRFWKLSVHLMINCKIISKKQDFKYSTLTKSENSRQEVRYRTISSPLGQSY